MSDSSTDQILSRTFALIEDNKQSEAKTLLQPLLDEEKNNPDVWWVYAHAVSNANEARDALNTVLLLEPNYPGATDLLQTLRTHLPDKGVSPKTMTSPASLPESFGLDDEFDLDDIESDLDESDEEWDDDFLEGDDDSDARPKRPRYLRILVPIVVILIILIFAALLLMNPTPPAQPTATPTFDAQVAATTNTPPALTQESASTSGVVDTTDFEFIASAFAAFDVPADGIEMLTTGLGDTLVVTICYPEGAESDDVLFNAMDTVANQIANIGDDVDALAVNIYDCGQDTMPRIIAITVSEARSYLNGEITDREFQNLWKLQDTR